MENQEIDLLDLYDWYTKIHVTSMLYGTCYRILRIYFWLNTDDYDGELLPQSWAIGGRSYVWLRWYARMVILINILSHMIVAIISHFFNITIILRRVLCYLNGFLSNKSNIILKKSLSCWQKLQQHQERQEGGEPPKMTIRRMIVEEWSGSLWHVQ